MGSEGPPDERVACEKLLGETASLDAPEPPRTALSCGWGRETHWWSRDGASWQRLEPIAPGPGESPLPGPRAIEFRVITAGGSGLVNLGEDGLGNVPVVGLRGRPILASRHSHQSVSQGG